jgi:calcium permeable stress-gated cation channel
LDNPEEMITLLANSLPAQSSYFIQIIFVFTFFVHGVELLRIYPLGMALLRRFVGPNLTKKEKRSTWNYIHSLEDPPDFFHAETCAQMVRQ